MSSTERKRSRMRTRSLFRMILMTALKKPEKLTVSRWAEKYRILGESFENSQLMNCLLALMSGLNYNTFNTNSGR